MPTGCKRWKAQYSLSTCRLLPVAAFCNGNDVNIHVEKPVKWWWTSYQVQLFIFHFSDMRAKSHVIRFQSVLVAVSFEICDHKNDDPLKKIKRGKKAKPPPQPKPLEIAQLFGQASPALYSLYPPAPTHPHPHRDRASMDRLCGWSLLHWLIGWPNTDDARESEVTPKTVAQSPTGSGINQQTVSQNPNGNVASWAYLNSSVNKTLRWSR